MPEAFDPYYKWLGIPRKDQPPNHYRLLGIEPFESDADVITHAADQRMGHLKAFQAGEHSVVTQQLLNQVAAAKLCLLNDESRRIYDEKLRASRPKAAGGPVPDSSRVGQYLEDAPSRPSAAPARQETAVPFGKWYAAAAIGLLLAAGWVGWSLRSGATRPEVDRSSTVDAVAPTQPVAAQNRAETTLPDGDRDDTEQETRGGAGRPRVPRPDADVPDVPPATESTEGPARETVAAQDGVAPSAGRSASKPRPEAEPPSDASAATNSERVSWDELRQRRSAAVAAGDFRAAMATITRMGTLREFDTLGERVEAFAQCREALGASAPREVRRELALGGIELLRAAVAAQRTDLVDRLGGPVLRLTRGLDDMELVRIATLLIVELQRVGGDIPPQSPSSIAENGGP